MTRPASKPSAWARLRRTRQWPRRSGPLTSSGTSGRREYPALAPTRVAFHQRGPFFIAVRSGPRRRLRTPCGREASGGEKFRSTDAVGDDRRLRVRCQQLRATMTDAGVASRRGVRQRRGVPAQTTRGRTGGACRRSRRRRHRVRPPQGARATTELRQLQYAEDDRRGVGKRSRIELAPGYVRGYTEMILDRADLSAFAASLPEGELTALMCVERDPEACHRS